MASTALVTGSSSGIGYQLAKLFARDGHNVVLVARSEGSLQRVAAELRGSYGVTVSIVAKDLSQSNSPDELYAELKNQSITVDFLVNNAGYGIYGAFGQSELGADLNVLQLNVVSLTHLTRLYLKDMLERGAGKILNLSSTAAFEPGPFMAIYYATKAYVQSFSEAIADEVRGSGVTVTALCPGPTQTGFQKKAAVEDIKLVSGPIMDAATVAKVGYRAMMQGRPVVIAGLRNQIMALGAKFGPRSVVIGVVRRLHRRETNPKRRQR